MRTLGWETSELGFLDRDGAGPFRWGCWVVVAGRWQMPVAVVNAGGWGDWKRLL